MKRLVSVLAVCLLPLFCTYCGREPDVNQPDTTDTLDTANHPPVFSADNDWLDSIGVDSLFQDTLHATDPDGDTLYFSFLDSTAGMHLQDSSITWTPGAADTGWNAIRLQVGDGKNGFDTLADSVFVPPAPPDTGGLNQDSLALLPLLPASGEVDSCDTSGTPVFYDSAHLYLKIDGFDRYYFDFGFCGCIFQRYLYPNPALADTDNYIDGRTFNLTINRMANADSAASIYRDCQGTRDTAQLLSTASYQAVILQGSWNLECLMQKGRYFIQFDGVYYDGITEANGAVDLIKAKLAEFCYSLSVKITGN